MSHLGGPIHRSGGASEIGETGINDGVVRLLEHEEGELADHVEEDHEDHKDEGEGKVQAVLPHLGRGTCIEQHLACMHKSALRDALPEGYTEGNTHTHTHTRGGHPGEKRRTAGCP